MILLVWTKHSWYREQYTALSADPAYGHLRFIRVRSRAQARRLVVDTGLHTKGWTRKQAIDYGISVSETERYVAAPGQACAYMIGQLKIMEVREKARRELGDKFSLKEFHNVVLRTGAVPLEVLEEVVNEYIAVKKQGSLY